MENRYPTEELEQITLMDWAKACEGRYPELRLLFHIPNGGKRGAREAAIFKAAGVKSGVPDLFLPVSRGGYNGLFVEMKRTKGGALSANQTRWLRDLQKQGYAAVVCHGWREAVESIEGYLNDR